MRSYEGDRTAAVMKALKGLAFFRVNDHPSMADYLRVTATTRELFEPVVSRIAAVAKR